MVEPSTHHVRDALRNAGAWIRSRQRDDGSWDEPSEETPTHAAIYLIGLYYLKAVERDDEAEIVRYLHAQRRADGGWSGAPDEPSSLDDTVLCYLAMRVSGVSPVDEILSSARQVIETLGGLTGTSIVPRFFLTLLGQMPREAFPYYSPRLVSSDWKLRRIWHNSGIFTLGVTALCLLNDHAAVRPLPPQLALTEFGPDRLRWRIMPDRPGCWPSHAALACQGKAEITFAERVAIRAAWFFIDLASRLGRRVDPCFAIEKTKQRAAESALKLQGVDGSFGEMLLPSIMNLMALDYAGGGRYQAEVRKGLKSLRHWLVSGPDGARQQLAPSTTHSTSYAVRSLLALDNPSGGEAIEMAVRWLVEHQTLPGGRFGRTLSSEGTPLGGWCFGVHGGINCDTDQTTIFLQSLSPLVHDLPEAFDRALSWVVSMQDRSGGWAAYTKNCRPFPVLSANLFSPLADEVLRPEVDNTARVLRVLGPLAGSQFDHGRRIEKAVRSGLAFLRRHQSPEGYWFGRWVVNFAPATGQVIDAMTSCGVDRNEPSIKRAADWLESVQNADGGWGESKNSYRHGAFESGPSNPLATAFASKGLIRQYGSERDSVLKAITYLLNCREGQTWQDPGWNGVCIPGVSYMRYHLTPTALVMTVLAEWLNLRQANSGNAVDDGQPGSSD